MKLPKRRPYTNTVNPVFIASGEDVAL